MSAAPPKGKKPTGRPKGSNKLTPEIHRKVVEFLRRGGYIETAAAYVGVAQSTLRDWLRQGARGAPAFAAFSEAVKKASAEAQMEGIDKIRDATDWQARAWFLERRWPHLFGRSSARPSKLEREKLKAETALTAVKLEQAKAGNVEGQVQVNLNVTPEEARKQIPELLAELGIALAPKDAA